MPKSNADLVFLIEVVNWHGGIREGAWITTDAGSFWMCDIAVTISDLAAQPNRSDKPAVRKSAGASDISFLAEVINWRGLREEIHVTANDGTVLMLPGTSWSINHIATSLVSKHHAAPRTPGIKA